MKKSLVVLFVLLLTQLPAGFSQNAADGGINWLSFTEAVKQGETSPKKVFIDVYTHWCGWCKRMDASTFKDSAIVNYINKNFYAVKLDAETKDSIRFKNQVFAFNPQYKANDLAVALLGGNMGYPNFVFLDENFNLLTAVSGYQTVEQLSPTLIYFYEDKYKTQSPEEFQKQQNQK